MFSPILKILDGEKPSNNHSRLVKIFNCQMTSRTISQTKDIRRRDEEVRMSDFGLSENQASETTGSLD